MLRLDHVFCLVAPDDRPDLRLEEAGWTLDQGMVHVGQGTRNRRLVWPRMYLELVWVADAAEAAGNPLRFDRRGDWQRSGVSPFGIGLRGDVPPSLRDRYWRYDQLGFPILVHRDAEAAPRRPLVFVLPEATEEARSRRPAGSPPVQPAGSDGPRTILLTGPEPAPLPEYEGPPVTWMEGGDHLELVLRVGPVRRVSDLLSLRG